MRTIVFTVTNELSFDQRMIRICSSVAEAGYDVLLVGFRRTGAPPLGAQPFRQKRLPLWIQKGPLSYLEINLRLLFFLLVCRLHAVCAIDLDTILPCWAASALRRVPRVYDAHELFCEMKEIVTRPRVYKAWKAIERFSVPRFPQGYTVNEPIRDILRQDYGVHYEVVRNIAVLRELPPAAPERFVIYQGAVNEGRSFETLIPAFKGLDVPFHIYGSGNYLEQAGRLIAEHGLAETVQLKGRALPADLARITPRALLGFTLFDDLGRSNYLSLANRFFDYIHAGIPQVCVDYPVYRAINEQFEVAVLVSDLSVEGLRETLRRTLTDEALLERLRANCLRARQELNWQRESEKLVVFYKKLFDGR
ncbi:glycosyltransferase [Flaviaesturariibacter amylovorans]|uniref:Glycosyltransferase n=1 Tax=Flaviaesturariibacter amylovorans TaxID=1084520 RepID=A0ABP8GSZ9_9BACT